jgi:hypothetical protein
MLAISRLIKIPASAHEQSHTCTVVMCDLFTSGDSLSVAYTYQCRRSVQVHGSNHDESVQMFCMQTTSNSQGSCREPLTRIACFAHEAPTSVHGAQSISQT